jgi:hypothetical protein
MEWAHLVALDEAVFVAGQGHVIEVVLNSHLLEKGKRCHLPILENNVDIPIYTATSVSVSISLYSSVSISSL